MNLLITIYQFILLKGFESKSRIFFKSLRLIAIYLTFRYAIVDVFGLIFIYLYLPETERRTLEDIELHFSDNNKKLSDTKISKRTNGKSVVSEKVINGCDNKAFEEQ